jgi:hypothetical protein
MKSRIALTVQIQALKAAGCQMVRKEKATHIGAVELVGVFTSSTISGHELILGL